jgi:phosphonopyruvate decarboxylase
MITATAFLDRARELGFGLFSGVPCSYLKPLINRTLEGDGLRYVGATNEGDAVAVASAAHLAGRRGVVMFQNSGLGNAVSPLTSLNAVFRIPVLVIATWRGEPGGEADEPQHELMGKITTGLFDLMRVRWEFFPDTDEKVGAAFGRAVEHMSETRLPYAFVMKKGMVADHPLRVAPPTATTHDSPLPAASWPERAPDRRAVLRTVQAAVRPTDAVLATTGHTGRDLYGLADRPSQFYMVGSMGCVSSLGLGLALSQPRRRVIVLDGDGAALMRLGSLGTIGHERPANLIHVLLDNGAHESTGGQSTVSATTDFAAVAQGCGYPRVLRATTPDEVAAAVATAEPGPTFVHVRTRSDPGQKLPRPTITPPQVADRFRTWLRQTAEGGAP